MYIILLRINAIFGLALDIRDESRKEQIIDMLEMNFDACCLARSH